MSERLFTILKRVLFPSDYTCDICGIETYCGNLCKQCYKKFEKNDKNVCPVCGRKTFRAEICIECKDKAPLYTKAVSPLVYTDNVKVLIGKFKNGSGYLKDYFADLVFKKLNLLPAFDCIVYVPMTASASARRGYNQTKLLAKALSKRTGIPVIYDAVEKVKDTKAQKRLSRRERESNLSGSFRVRKPEEIRDKTVLIVDDVLTTGATVDAMTKRLLQAGAKKTYVAVIASVENKPFYTGRYEK